MNKRDSTFEDDNFGATYTLDGNHYEETYFYHPISKLVGRTGKQLLELQNDTLVRTFPFNDNWELERKRYSIEKFIRLENIE